MRIDKKSVGILLMATVLFSASCGSGAAENMTSDDQKTSEQSAETTAGRDSVSDGLPEKNYDGTDFVILTRTLFDYEFNSEADGDVLNDAVYKRGEIVSDWFGVNITTVKRDCDWPSTEFNSTLKSSVMAGDGAYDLVAGYAATIPNLIGENIFLDWNKMKYNDFTKPWWCEQAVEEFTINGKCFMVTGDISLTLWERMRCMMYNKRLAAEYGGPDLYDVVAEGNWTLDELGSVTKNVWTDLDGDGKKSKDDRFGFMINYSNAADNLKEAFEIYVTKKGDDGLPKLTFMNERTQRALEKLNTYFATNDVLFSADIDEYDTLSKKAFREGRAMIVALNLGSANEMRSMDDDFGIIPYPKLDSEQKEYHSTAQDNFSFFVAPIDVKDAEMTSIITEALASESYKNVIPVFYDVALKTKSARDEESSAMIDLIRDTLTFDFGYINSGALDSAGHLWIELLRKSSNDLASEYAKKETSYNEKLSALLEAYK